MPRYRTRSWRAFEPGAVTRAAAAPTSRLRILGLDPGSQRTGFGLIECHGPDSAYVAHGCLTATGSALSERLRAIFEGVVKLIEQHQPDEIAVERVFVNRNADSALKLGQARGAALCAVPQSLPVFEYAPRAVKMALVGFGGAEKPQVAHMVRTLLKVEGRMPADASDALAIALCHAHTRRMGALIQGAAVSLVRVRAR